MPHPLCKKKDSMSGWPRDRQAYVQKEGRSDVVLDHNAIREVGRLKMEATGSDLSLDAAERHEESMEQFYARRHRHIRDRGLSLYAASSNHSIRFPERVGLDLKSMSKSTYDPSTDLAQQIETLALRSNLKTSQDWTLGKSSGGATEISGL